MEQKLIAQEARRFQSVEVTLIIGHMILIMIGAEPNRAGSRSNTSLNLPRESLIKVDSS